MLDRMSPPLCEQLGEAAQAKARAYDVLRRQGIGSDVTSQLSRAQHHLRGKDIHPGSSMTSPRRCRAGAWRTWVAFAVYKTGSQFRGVYTNRGGENGGGG